MSFYKIPVDVTFRGIYLTRIARGPNFKVTDNTRICSAHWANGKKAPENPLPTVFPLKQNYTCTPRRVPLKRAVAENGEPVYKKRKYTKFIQDKGTYRIKVKL